MDKEKCGKTTYLIMEIQVAKLKLALRSKERAISEISEFNLKICEENDQLKKEIIHLKELILEYLFGKQHEKSREV